MKNNNKIASFSAPHRKALLSSIFSLCITALLNTTPAHAADITIVDGQTVTIPQAIADGDTIFILDGGIVTTNLSTITGTSGTTITVDNAGTVESASSTGIYTVSGTLILFNRASGTITANNYAGIEARDIANLINEGKIIGGNSDGIKVYYTLTNLTNSGTIIGNDNGVASDDITTLTNSGSITGDSSGVRADNIITLTNSGSIIGDTSEGIVAITSLTTLTNSGKITGYTSGINVLGGITTLVNSGTITGKTGEGVRALGAITSLTNTGSIISNTEGIYALGGFTTLVNSGIIRSETSEGVRALSAITSLTNTGSIIGNTDGIYASGGIRNITNAGIISGNTYAIRSGGSGNAHLTLLNGSNIFGAIDLGSGTSTLTVGKGLSINHIFLASHGRPDVINANDAPLFVSGNQVVVVDTTDFNNQQDKTLFDLTTGIFNTVFNNIGDGRNPASSFTNGPAPQFSLGAISPTDTKADNDKSHAWASVFGSHRSDDNTRQGLGGLIIGLDGRINNSLRLGTFFGTSRTDVDFVGDAGEMETDSIFGGLYASLNAQGLTIDLGVTGGKTDHEGIRAVDNNQINGMQKVTSDFNGTFIAPELSIKTRTDLGGVTIQPTLSAGYAGLFMDSYTEAGTAPLTVSENDIHIIHARLEIAALMHTKGDNSLNFQYSLYVGIEGRSLINGEATNISMFGTSYNFKNDDGDEDIGSAFAGFRLSVLQTETFGIFAGLEGSVDTESSTLLTANAGLKWQF